jgi:hypothetical protein
MTFQKSPTQRHASLQMIALLYRPIFSRKDTEDLQQDLAALEDWEKQWQMAFHQEKCVVIQISSKRSTIPANYTLHNHQLDVVDSSKYLRSEEQVLTRVNNIKLVVMQCVVSRDGTSLR